MAVPRQTKNQPRALTKTKPQPVIPTRSTGLNVAEEPHVMKLQHNLALLEECFKLMEPGVDYGTVPGIKKPFLKIPGTERLQQMFNLRIDLEDIDSSDPQNDFFRHKIFARAYQVEPETGEQVYLGMGVGICSSKESKYRFRWAKAEEIPTQMKSGMTGYYSGKDGAQKETIDSQKWIDLYGSGTAKMTQYGARFRINNADIADLDNTIIKQAAKRARADVVQNVTGAHRMFARAEEAEDAGVDSIAASRYEEQAADSEAVIEDPREYPREVLKPTSPSANSDAKKESPTTTPTDTGSEPAPSPTPLSAPTSQKEEEVMCPNHPGQKFIKYPTKGGGTTYAHKIGTDPNGKPVWCFRDQVMKQQSMAPTQPKQQSMEFSDLDLVDVKDTNEFLHVIKDFQKRLNYSDSDLVQFLKNNYPTSGTDISNLPLAVRKPLLKDLAALLQSTKAL